jgi:hypothetical protein
MSGRKVKVTGIRRREINPDEYAMVLWLIAKRQVRERREREEKERKRRQEVRHEQ